MNRTPNDFLDLVSSALSAADVAIEDLRRHIRGGAQREEDLRARAVRAHIREQEWLREIARLKLQRAALRGVITRLQRKLP